MRGIRLQQRNLVYCGIAAMCLFVHLACSNCHWSCHALGSRCAVLREYLITETWENKLQPRLQVHSLPVGFSLVDHTAKSKWDLIKDIYNVFS